MKKNKIVSFPPLIIPINKPVDISSAGFLNKFKWRLPQGVGKVGHFGTLDPFANGLLLVGIAGAARLSNDIHAMCSKTYIAKGVVGVKTPTGDLTVNSEFVEEFRVSDEIKKLSSEKINETLNFFKGKYCQTPPKFSAIKVDGKRAYDLARKGIDFKVDPVEREIKDLKLISYDFPYLTFEVTCSSGTYVRTLFEDICLRLGSVGALKELKRFSIGSVSVKRAFPDSNWINLDVKNSLSSDLLKKFAIQPDELVQYPTVQISKTDVDYFFNGRNLNGLTTSTGKCWVKYEDVLLGLSKVSEHGALSPEIVFPQMRMFIKY